MSHLFPCTVLCQWISGKSTASSVSNFLCHRAVFQDIFSLRMVNSKSPVAVTSYHKLSNFRQHLFVCDSRGHKSVQRVAMSIAQSLMRLKARTKWSCCLLELMFAPKLIKYFKTIQFFIHLGLKFTQIFSSQSHKVL